MTGAHLHLILNHIPVLGTVFGLLHLAFAMLRKNEAMVKVSLGVFVLTGLVAVAVYLTGESAEEVVEHLPGISEALIELHEETGLFALIAAGVLGVVSLGGLLLFRRKSLPKWIAVTALILALAVSGVMGWTANLGGQISHPEIRSDQATVQTSGGEQPGTHEEDDDD